MKFGVSIFFTDETAHPGQVAPLVEELGFQSLWLPEHSHMPVRGPDFLGREYQRLYDAFVTLGYMAAVTSQLRLGTSVTLIGMRDPIWTAKMSATLDRLSSGRLDFGVGYGWIREEIENHGVDFKRRREIAREHLRVIRSFWTQDQVAHQGANISITDSVQWPKPIQQPHPPIYVGAGLGPRTLSDIVEFASGWIPLGRFDVSAQQIERVRKATKAKGRQVEVLLYENSPSRERIKAAHELGCDQVIFRVAASEGVELRDELHRLADLREAL